MYHACRLTNREVIKEISVPITGLCSNTGRGRNEIFGSNRWDQSLQSTCECGF